MMHFDWDERKNESNYKKHGIRFEEARTIWLDPCSREYFDLLHSVEEERFIKIGFSGLGRLLTCVFTERPDHVRLISARFTTVLERKVYEERI